jgi:hypothetical protein
MSRLDPSTETEVRVTIPADTDRADRLVAGLTARQLCLLAVPAVALWVAWAALRRHVPLPVFLAAAAPVAMVATGLALGRRDGLGLDRLVVMALRHVAGPRRFVPAPGGVPAAPAVLGVTSGPLPTALRLPVEQVGADGTLGLGRDGTALVCRAVGASFALRTARERAGMVAALARYLNGTAGPFEIVVHAEPVDLRPAIMRLREAAGGLPHPALEAAALDHAAFLSELSATRDLLAREVLVVFRDAVTEGAPDRLARRAAAAGSALQAAGVQLRVLGAAETSAVLAAALDPFAPRRTVAVTPAYEPVHGPALRSTASITSLPNDAAQGDEP